MAVVTIAVSTNPLDNPSDRDLVQRCVGGDTASFRLLYQRHQQRVRSTLFQLCDSSTLDDLVQEVFLRAWKGLPKFKQTAQFSTWLYRIAWNVAYDYRQAAAQNRSRLQVIKNETPAHYQALDLAQLHYQDLVQRGLEQLSFDHRTVLVLHDLEELPQKEVAEILGIPTGTVKSRLFHARAAMRQFLQQQGVQL
ncbi:MAG: sigma-70 family RNA polymerase sigma factor [Scytolyngbya sp. HA4215-MV1]|jgi:RNA polymerase sigma-70 factor (ECF subfamily)|nr:sigma-70 family RNA polymerase sigma factor [Scytolyngbya sp. HA4215-MV1]